MHEFPVIVLGASGYAGRELCALVQRHPRLHLAAATANSRAGETLDIAGTRLTLGAHEEADLSQAAVVFTALPHGAAAPWVERAAAAGARVVDLSADLRPGSAGASASIPYGMPEIARATIPPAQVVANPGCYPTAILLALAPLIEQGLVPAGAAINIVAASGVTGAGFTPRPDLLFAEVFGDFKAYGTGNEHRHLAEMRATIAKLGGDVDLIFTPQLLPVPRGILATITVPLTAPLANPSALWRSRYALEPFVEISDAPPALRDVVGRNAVRIFVQPLTNMRQPTLLVIAAIDNLVKGAAGQAVQNANLLLGLDETMGLAA